jgi:tripartite-type tricarboxylate transporter receptor subunit TctC
MEVTPSLPVKTVSEFITYTKANLDKVGYASGGIGSPQHVASELFKLMAGVEMLHVPSFRNVSLARGTSGCQ